jgi:hypothetical protein
MYIPALLNMQEIRNWNSRKLVGYSNIPKPVTEHEDITVLWNQGIQTDRKVLENWPDIIVKNKKDKTCLLIDVAMSSDKNVIQKKSWKEIKV